MKEQTDKTKEEQTEAIHHEIMHQWYEALAEADLAVISFEHCCKLLAANYVCPIEAFLYNLRLREHLLYAQRRTRIIGGETPDPNAVRLIAEYIKEVNISLSRPISDPLVFFQVEYPQWMHDLFKEYGETVPKQQIS